MRISAFWTSRTIDFCKENKGFAEVARTGAQSAENAEFSENCSLLAKVCSIYA